MQPQTSIGSPTQSWVGDMAHYRESIPGFLRLIEPMMQGAPELLSIPEVRAALLACTLLNWDALAEDDLPLPALPRKRVLARWSRMQHTWLHRRMEAPYAPLRNGTKRTGLWPILDRGLRAVYPDLPNLLIDFKDPATQLELQRNVSAWIYMQTVTRLLDHLLGNS